MINFSFGPNIFFRYYRKYWGINIVFLEMLNPKLQRDEDIFATIGFLTVVVF
jgi:hypothetical protein